MKLDHTFMRTPGSNAKDEAIARWMVAMSEDTGYRVVAGGVETEEALELLRLYVGRRVRLPDTTALLYFLCVLAASKATSKSYTVSGASKASLGMKTIPYLPSSSG